MGPASKDTMSGWLKQVMTAAGLDTSIFKSHSTRIAATSAAKVANVPLDEIMATAGWRSSSVFAVFYKKHCHVRSLLLAVYLERLCGIW